MGAPLTPEEFEAEGLATAVPKKLTPEELAAEGLSSKPEIGPNTGQPSWWDVGEEARAYRGKTLKPTFEAAEKQATQKLRSGLNTATYGMAPTIVGALEGGEEAAQTKRDYAEAAKAQPEAARVGAALAPFPGSGSLKGPAKYLTQAAIGALASGTQAYNASPEPTVGGRLKESLLPAAIGGAAAPAAGLLASGASKLAGRFSSQAEKIIAKDLAKDIETLKASAAGKYGQSVQDANRALINIKEAISDPNTSAALKADAAAFLSSAEGAALAEQVGKNTLEAAPAKLGKMTGLKEDLANAPATAAAANAVKNEKNALVTQTLPRISRYARAGLGAVGGGLLGEAAESAGVLPEGYGTAVGAAAGASLGRPGGSLANMLKNPQFASQARNVIARALNEGGNALMRFGHTGAQLSALDSAEARAKELEALSKTPQGEADIAAGLELENPLKKRFGAQP